MNDEDLMNIVDEIFEEMEVEDIIEEMIDELSKINRYLITVTASDCSEDLTKISEKIIANSQINALNERTKQCVIYFYYSTDTAFAVCASCMISLADVRIEQMYTKTCD